MSNQFYVARAGIDKIVRGSQLENGMIVLLEDSLLRGYDKALTDSDASPYDKARAEETLQWCKVTDVAIRNGIVTFIGEYEDGTMRVRQYSANHHWIVRLPQWPGKG